MSLLAALSGFGSGLAEVEEKKKKQELDKATLIATLAKEGLFPFEPEVQRTQTAEQYLSPTRPALQAPQMIMPENYAGFAPGFGHLQATMTPYQKQKLEEGKTKIETGGDTAKMLAEIKANASKEIARINAEAKKSAAAITGSKKLTLTPEEQMEVNNIASQLPGVRSYPAAEALIKKSDKSPIVKNELIKRAQLYFKNKGAAVIGGMIGGQ